MQRRSLITFVILNVLISVGVAFGVISLLGPQNAGGAQQMVITVPVIFTPTVGPSQTPWIVTATLQENRASVPAELFGGTPDLTTSPIPTLDPELLGANVALANTATALPQNCILHTVKEGDTPFGIAEQYGADGFRLMEVNGMDETAAASMQIGDTLIVPLEGCALSAITPTPEATPTVEAGETTDEATEEDTEEAATRTPTPRPTVTLAPTDAAAQMEILQIVGAGDITEESVEIRNNGGTVNIQGWTLGDEDGDTFTFPEQLIFSNALLTVNTRAGSSTPIVLFWGRDEAAWQPGDVITLTDANGVVQSTYRVPSPVNLN